MLVCPSLSHYFWGVKGVYKWLPTNEINWKKVHVIPPCQTTLNQSRTAWQGSTRRIHSISQRWKTFSWSFSLVPSTTMCQSISPHIWTEQNKPWQNNVCQIEKVPAKPWWTKLPDQYWITPSRFWRLDWSAHYKRKTKKRSPCHRSPQKATTNNIHLGNLIQSFWNWIYSCNTV